MVTSVEYDAWRIVVDIGVAVPQITVVVALGPKLMVKICILAYAP